MEVGAGRASGREWPRAAPGANSLLGVGRVLKRGWAPLVTSKRLLSQLGLKQGGESEMREFGGEAVNSTAELAGRQEGKGGRGYSRDG